MSVATADLYDDFADELAIVPPVFRSFGGREAFCGEVVTLKVFEDNSLVRELSAEPGLGRVLVVDGGGSLRRALLGDRLASRAMDNGWAGVVIDGCVRDAAILRNFHLGIQARAAVPAKTIKRGEGQRDLAVQIAGVTVRPGDWLYADADGIVIASRKLHG